MRRAVRAGRLTRHGWRRGWDSDPRALSDKTLSRRPRYDHFGTSPLVVLAQAEACALQAGAWSCAARAEAPALRAMTARPRSARESPHAIRMVPSARHRVLKYKEPSGNKYSMSPCSSRVNRVIPVTVEAMPFETHRGHLGVRHSDPARIVAAIQF